MPPSLRRYVATHGYPALWNAALDVLGYPVTWITSVTEARKVEHAILTSPRKVLP